MNKYAIIGIALVLILIIGFAWQEFFSGQEDVVETGIVHDITIISEKQRWEFNPEEIEVNQGDRLRLTVINEDDYDHGFAIDAFGISQRLPAEGSIQVEFLATKVGDFPYYCSVSCGDGIVDGVERGHFDHIGKVHVSGLISETN
jgi:heme/copper-type cytochrome/quinol oxidase subunit 2